MSTYCTQNIQKYYKIKSAILFSSVNRVLVTAQTYPLKDFRACEFSGLVYTAPIRRTEKSIGAATVAIPDNSIDRACPKQRAKCLKIQREDYLISAFKWRLIYGILISGILLCILLPLTLEGSFCQRYIYGLCQLLAKVNKNRNTTGKFDPKTIEVH